MSTCANAQMPNLKKKNNKNELRIVECCEFECECASKCQLPTAKRTNAQTPNAQTHNCQTAYAKCTKMHKCQIPNRMATTPFQICWSAPTPTPMSTPIQLPLPLPLPPLLSQTHGAKRPPMFRWGSLMVPRTSAMISGDLRNRNRYSLPPNSGCSSIWFSMLCSARRRRAVSCGSSLRPSCGVSVVVVVVVCV